MKIRLLNPLRRPNLICIGAAKSGTTWLATVLSAHPEIFMPAQKELNCLYYDDLDRRLREYENYFEHANSEKIRCDFSVRYLSSPNAPAAAERYVPDTKILMLVRNPVYQIQSHYWHLLRQNFHQSRPIKVQPSIFEALDRFPDLLLEPALYGKHIKRWLNVFSRDRFHFICQDDCSVKTDVVMADLIRFLEIEPFDFKTAIELVSASDSRGGVQPRTGILGKIYPSIYAVITRGPMRWIKSIIGVQRSDTLKRTLRMRQLSEAVFFKPGYELLDKPKADQLLDFVRDDIECFSELTQFDVSQWIKCP